jgi:hypothetical protein
MRKAISVRSRGTMLDLLSDLAQCDTPARSILTSAAELMKQRPEERIYSIEQTHNVFYDQWLTSSDLDKLAKSGVSIFIDTPLDDLDDEDEDEED